MSEELAKIDELNPKQELFCQMYVNNGATFGNATLAYASAYDLDANYHGTDQQKSDYAVANVCGPRLLVNVGIKARVVKLLNALLKDEIVDAELSKVIQQDGDLGPKMSAIKEYNRIKGRGSDVVEHKFDFTDLIRQKNEKIT